MSKEIWLAPILSDNRDRLLARASEVLAAGPAESLLYLAASRPLLEIAAARLLDGDRIRGVWGSLPVHLFRGFARFVLATAIDDETGLPLPPRIAIDREEFPLKRSLLSQIIKRLAREGRIKALAPLAHRDGCVNSIATLIGEIQRAGKSPNSFNSIVEARLSDLRLDASSEDREIPLQIDFEREIGLIYAGYADALERFGLTEDDADALLALEVLRGEVDGKAVSLPWLAGVRMLVLDGFFDFTPVQGEMLRLLIPQIPEVIVNLNRDERNVEIFRPFSATIDQLTSISSLEIKVDTGARPVDGDLSMLRERLFKPSEASRESSEPADEKPEPPISHLECADRQTEVRAIAKRIKRLVFIEGYKLGEIGLVVRELASYAETITRVFEEESIPSSLRRHVQLADVPAARAAVKLLELLIELCREGAGAMKVGDLADVIKSGYFRLSELELDSLRRRVNWGDGRRSTGIGQLWDVDELENVIAFVGSQLRLDRWLARARQLSARPPALGDDKERTSEDEDQTDAEESSFDPVNEPFIEKRAAIRVEPVEVPLPGSERKPKPARDLEPASIAWAAVIVERISQVITGLIREGGPAELRTALMRLLEQLQFATQVRGTTEMSEQDLPALTLDWRGLEGLRRALFAAERSFEISEKVLEGDSSETRITLATFLDETMRCIKAQSLMLSGEDPDGLKVLEVSDIRGLRFRALFIAGLVEGGFPMRASRDWIYPDEERKRLKRYGLTLEDISADTLLKEEHYFYQAACRATERLYLSRPLVLEDGSETVASYYVDEVARAVAPATIKREFVRNDFDGQSLFESSRPSELAVLAVRQEERWKHRAQRAENFPEVAIARVISMARDEGYLTESAVRRIGIERERGSRRFGRFDGLIAEKGLLEKLARHYGESHEFSASELSLYGRCPFKFFAERVLKLEPRGEAALDLSALDAGSLLHEALRRFFELHRGQRLVNLDREVLRREIGEVADQVFDEYERTVPPLNHHVWSIDRGIRKLLLEQVLDYELSVEAKTESKGVRPAHFELAFGMPGGEVDPSSTSERLALHRGAGNETETLRIRGQIDRVDLADDGTAIAYDYKLSKGPSLDDMQEGRALQLHIYLAALEQLFWPGKDIAGGGYYTMKSAQDRRNRGIYRETFNAYTAVKGHVNSSVTEAEWVRIRGEMESRIWEFAERIRAGRFEVDPSAPETTCPYCDYSAVCRYEKFRIRRKKPVREETKKTLKMEN